MMDGSVSTLAPLFATALATRDSHTAFLVGVAAAVGAGTSMAFAEALSDDGSVTGRGNPWVRGLIEGFATMVGGLGHTLPFLIADVQSAVPVASGVVVVELLIISWLRFHYFRMPFAPVRDPGDRGRSACFRRWCGDWSLVTWNIRMDLDIPRSRAWASLALATWVGASRAACWPLDSRWVCIADIRTACGRWSTWVPGATRRRGCSRATLTSC